MSVNNKGILRVQVGFNWLLFHLLMLLCDMLDILQQNPFKYGFNGIAIAYCLLSQGMLFT